MDFKRVEEKWQKWWNEHPEIYGVQDPITPSTGSGQAKPKKYVLVEFPYPSGYGLHVGHAFTFTGGDVYARYMRMKGFNVLFPMGWDAFGLPTENYAIKKKRKPQEVTKENTDMFRSQMKKLAFSFDWEREVNTTDPNYYKWTQWIFIQLYKKGLAYKKEMPINWCPSCKIGLANEEVIDSKCERCGAEVSRRNISQWVVKITDYADRLIDGLKDTDFIDKVKRAQINWIGKSEGATIRFKINDKRATIKDLEVFTTRPDTLYGATFMVIAPEHNLINQIVNNQDTNKNFQTIPNDQIQKIKQYLNEARKKSDMERTDLNKDKTGVFSGLYAINPINNKEIPIWISDFVLATYGTGAIMSVPAHDERDKAFAKKYDLPIIEVVDDQGKMINSADLDGMDYKDAGNKIIDWLKEKGIGNAKGSYHLRDWIFSRQHYWGEPIPMIFCEQCSKNQITNYELRITNEDEKKRYYGWFTVPEKELPIRLPEVEAYEPTDDGKSPLSKIEEFVKCKCPVCGGEARRETDTMPNWAGSDWYYLAYTFANKLNNGIDCHDSTKVESRNDAKADDIVGDIFSASKEEQKYWMPVDVYVGGDEHNTLHMLYSRFIHQFLYDLGVVTTPEPYYKRISHGVILGSDNNRMSKSKGNVIVPEIVADKYGVDVVRMYLMFMGPFEGTMAWNEKTLMGVKRFLDKYEKTISNCQLRITNDSSKEVKMIINKLVKEVGDDLEQFGFNTAIAKMMKALNTISNDQLLMSNENIKTLIKLIAPLAPYMAEELWSKLGEKSSVHQQKWPEYDEKLLVEDTVTIAVAVNGKVRGELRITNYELREGKEIIEEAKKLKKIKQWIEGKEMVKEIYVPGKMINLVIK